MVDYQKLGFRCGIEVHQQLDGRKLFCHCPTINSNKEPDISIIRKLRVSAGETGEVDAAAKYEVQKDRYYNYVGNSEDVCLVEIDDEPIHDVSEKALNSILTIATLLNARIVDEVQFMRKIVVDGSNVSGFQRTGLVAEDGYIETSKGKVPIPVICLEEEAAQKLEATDEFVKYKLDRLGIPLIEIATDASIKDQEHAKEVAEKLGMILRSAGVKRGLGTIRQDVNVSIKGGARTEIKGFQDLRSIPKVIEYEVNRQLKEIKAGKKLKPEVRKAESDLTTSFLRPMPGAARMYPETDARTVKITKEMLKGIKLPELISDKIKALEKFGLQKEVASKIAKKGQEEFYIKTFNKLKNLKPSFIVDTFASVRNELEKDFKVKQVTDEQIEKALSLVNDNKIPKSSLNQALADIVNDRFDESKFKGVDDSKLEEEIKKIIKDKPGLNPGAYMGLIMKKFQGKVDGKKAMDILKKLL